jgi:hypothetical protein
VSVVLYVYRVVVQDKSRLRLRDTARAAVRRPAPATSQAAAASGAFDE